MKALLLIFLLPLYAVSGSANDVLGEFWSPEKDGKVRIYEKDGIYFGNLFWSSKPNRLDTENPDESLRSRKVMGQDIFYDFKYDEGDDEWNGYIYDPKSGNTYKCNMWLVDGGKTLKVRGYVGFSWIGRTEEFERIK